MDDPNTFGELILAMTDEFRQREKAG